MRQQIHPVFFISVESSLNSLWAIGTSLAKGVFVAIMIKKCGFFSANYFYKDGVSHEINS